MRLTGILLAIAAAGLLLGSTSGQEQPHVTAVIKGPDAVSPGSRATYDIDVSMSGNDSIDVYIDWFQLYSALPVCCDYLTSSVRSGVASLYTPVSGQESTRWTVRPPGAQIELVLAIRSPIATDTV